MRTELSWTMTSQMSPERLYQALKSEAKVISIAPWLGPSIG